MIQMTHRYEMREGIPQIVIYVYTSLDYEFAQDFDIIRYNASNTADKIREYVKSNFSDVEESTIMLIVNGVILGSVSLTNVLSKA